MGLSLTTIAWVAVILIAMIFWMYCDIHNNDRV